MSISYIYYIYVYNFFFWSSSLRIGKYQTLFLSGEKIVGFDLAPF